MTPNGPPVVTTGQLYTPSPAITLTAGQAAGTSPILTANPARTGLFIQPPSDCLMAIAAAPSAGMSIFGGVPNSFNGAKCPTNAIYVQGLTAGTVIAAWES